MRVAIVKVDDSQLQCLIEQLSLLEQIFLENTQQQLRPPTLLYHMLPLHQLRFLLLKNVLTVVLISIVPRIPLIDLQLVVLLLLNCL